MRYSVLIVSLLLAHPVAAQQKDPVACEDTALSQSSMTRCAGEAHKESRARLDSLVVELRPALDTSERPGLDSTQALWLAYATAQCRWQGSAFEGGSMQPMQVAYCRAWQNELRIRELAPMLCDFALQVDTCPRAAHYLGPATPVKSP